MSPRAKNVCTKISNVGIDVNLIQIYNELITFVKGREIKTVCHYFPSEVPSL